jgi:predicted dehydrogenase
VTAPATIRLGVVGLGLIAQVVHLPNLRRLADRYSVTHVCDLSRSLAVMVAGSLGGSPRWSVDPEAVFADPDVDAVLILTPGAHGPLVAAALAAGKHVLSEKPLCLTQREARELAAAAAGRRLVLQVGYMKLYDPAMAPARAALERIGTVRLVRITVRHPTTERQSAHLGVRHGADVDLSVIAADQVDARALTRVALGETDPDLGRLYRDVLVGSISHELSVLRALGIGLPATFRSAHGWRAITPDPGDPVDLPSVTAVADLDGGALLQLDWLWLPRYPRYQERISIIGTAGEVTLDIPEPYGPNVEAKLRVDLPDGGDTTATVRRAVHDSGFLAELRAFHDSVTAGAPVRSDAEGARQDTACLQALAAAIARDQGMTVGGEAAHGEAAHGEAAHGEAAHGEAAGPGVAGSER